MDAWPGGQQDPLGRVCLSSPCSEARICSKVQLPRTEAARAHARDTEVLGTQIVRQFQKVCVGGGAQCGKDQRLLPMFESLLFREPGFLPGRRRAGPVEPTKALPSTFPGPVEHSVLYTLAHLRLGLGCT